MSQQFNVSPDNLRMAIDYIADFEIVVNRCACEKGPLVTCDRDSELVPEPAFPESADTFLAHTHSALLRSPCGNHSDSEVGSYLDAGCRWL
jgi:hypothetical protein